LEFLRIKDGRYPLIGFRFHFEPKNTTSADHPLKQALASQLPHLLIRKLDKEDDYFVAIAIFGRPDSSPLKRCGWIHIRYSLPAGLKSAAMGGWGCVHGKFSALAL